MIESRTVATREAGLTTRRSFLKQCAGAGTVLFSGSLVAFAPGVAWPATSFDYPSDILDQCVIDIVITLTQSTTTACNLVSIVPGGRLIVMPGASLVITGT